MENIEISKEAKKLLKGLKELEKLNNGHWCEAELTEEEIVEELKIFLEKLTKLN